MLLYFVYFAKHSQGTWLCQEVAQSTTSLIFPAQTPACVQSAPASASYQLLITSACSMQHATSNCERENNYERTKNSLEDEEDSYSGHRKHVPSRFLRLISMHAHTHTHTDTHTPTPHTCLHMHDDVHANLSKSLCLPGSSRCSCRPLLLDKCKYGTLCVLCTANRKHLFNATIVLQAQLLQH